MLYEILFTFCCTACQSVRSTLCAKEILDHLRAPNPLTIKLLEGVGNKVAKTRKIKDRREIPSKNLQLAQDI